MTPTQPKAPSPTGAQSTADFDDNGNLRSWQTTRASTAIAPEARRRLISRGPNAGRVAPAPTAQSEPSLRERVEELQNNAAYDLRNDASDIAADGDATIAALQDVLLRNGFVRCDDAACNCGSWHARYGYKERFDEFEEALADAGHPACNENGNLAIKALASLVEERDAQAARIAALQAAIAESCDEERSQKWEAGPSGGGCSRALAAEKSIEVKNARIAELEAGIATWSMLRDPVILHANLLRGLPAQLDRATFLHLAGDGPGDELARLRAQVERADERGDEAMRRAHAAEVEVARLSAPVEVRPVAEVGAYDICQDHQGPVEALSFLTAGSNLFSESAIRVLQARLALRAFRKCQRCAAKATTA